MAESSASSELDLSARIEQLRSRLNAAKIAYMHRTPLDGHEVSYEDLEKIATELIHASYAYQKMRYGSVKVKISVAKLLRRGR